MPALPPDQVRKFVEDGFVHLPGAFSRSLADECRAILWADSGADPDNPTTWRQPVIRIVDGAEEPFRLAANTPRLHAALDNSSVRGTGCPGSASAASPSGSRTWSSQVGPVPEQAVRVPGYRRGPPAAGAGPGRVPAGRAAGR
ncbi:hypothetical protein GTS_31780 [Gandjariella thermophila]|uniref:Uncharacterized protein n=1 Tax=Gandjariella thermophila TaxID=1931992 RepID=A0A4D4J4D5_9PSEU|nr:hypothetical protein GTS_31780 [Gandjariella thermophila]